MKRIIGILLVSLMCITLGALLDNFKEAEVSLVGEIQ